LHKSKKERKPLEAEHIFLIVATIAGLAFALLQPLFIEPDASYHFDKSSYLSNTVVDRASIGFPAEDYQSQPVPYTTVTTMKKEGTYFKNFFETKLPTIPRDQVADHRAVGVPWYKDIMHLVPALGVKIGHAIYPSIGSMVLTARIFNLIFFLVSMFFIIKKLKIYRMFFTAISITPVVIQFAASLSYDIFTYIACAWLIATLLNTAARFKENEEIPLKKVIPGLILPSIAAYFSKSNSKLILVLVVAVIIYAIGKKLKINLSKLQVGIGIVLIIVAGLGVFYLRYHENLYLIISKFFYTFLEPYYTVLTTEVISGTNTNSVPAWFFPIQVAMLILLMLSYTKERVPRWFAVIGAALFALNIVGVLLTFAINPAFAEHVITGPQGRYFTVFILLLAPIFTLLAGKITVQSDKWLKRLVITVSIFALVFNLGITSVKFYHLQLPADEYRSGIEHYIFK
jgi:uncharacterized membrane protein